MFQKMPLVLCLTIAAVLLLNPFMPLEAKQIIYATSLSIKSLIVFMLPFIIFGLLFKTMVVFARGATALIALILVCVCFSNALSTFISHFVGEWIYHLDFSILTPQNNSVLEPAWTLSLPKLVSNDSAMFSGILLGIAMGGFYQQQAQKLATLVDVVITKTLNSFTYLIPLFVAGFALKLQYDGEMVMILKDYAFIFALIAITVFAYILFVYALLAGFNPREFIRIVKNMLPAAMAGFCTMSSAAVMPITIAGAMRNAKNKDIVRLVVPATVNIHLIGDCFAIPIFAYAVMKSFGIPAPTLAAYLVFVFYFVIAKFSVAAIPGGGIVVMLPILENCLGFNGEMLSLITALYILFDLVITCANVLGNGAFAKLIDQLVSLRSKMTQTTGSGLAESN
jgi:Na+/H+-dicarboxylate symporter